MGTGRGERFFLSAFCGVGGAKWGEGRGEVLRFTILSVSIRVNPWLKTISRNSQPSTKINYERSNRND
jgi:hypothetical protein